MSFIIQGLKEVSKELKAKNIGFNIILSSEKEFLSHLNSSDLGMLVFDFSPLNEDKNLREKLAKMLDIACVEVDSHNIIPCRFASSKQEFAAATFRPKIKTLIYEFLTAFPALKIHPTRSKLDRFEFTKLDFSKIEDKSVSELSWIKAGEKQAIDELKNFIDQRLDFYEQDRNDPTKYAFSNLSPYLHFGHISSQRVALEVLGSDCENINKESFLEELIVRKELADNYCFYNSDYKSIDGLALWARETLNYHRHDVRAYVYLKDEFEKAKTHDNLWNAAQNELLKRGKIHSYMRMYWAKKILEWSQCPEEALETAIYLNDKYSLDGLDPNGYTGILWSIGGLHDRAWFDRDVFGKIRYMNYEGCKRKFDVELYIQTIESI